MVRAKDYIDDMDAFSSGLEESVAYLGLLDLLLKAAAEEKTFNKLYEEKTIEEIGRMPENLQGNLQPVEEVRLEAGKILKALRERSEKSEGAQFYAEDGMSITYIASVFGLRDFSFLCLLMAVAPSLDENYCDEYRMLRSDNDSHGLPTIALAEMLYGYMADEDALLTARKERGIIERCPAFRVVSNGDLSSELNDSFRISRQLSALIKGEVELPENLKSICYENDEEGEPVAPGKEYERIDNLLKSDSFRVLNIYGKKGSGRKFLVSCAVQGNVLYINSDIILMSKEDDIREDFLDALVRAKVLGMPVVLADMNVTHENAETAGTLISSLLRVLDRIIVTSSGDESIRSISEKYAYHSIEIKPPMPSARILFWKKMAEKYGSIDEKILTEVSGLYSISPGTIKGAVQSAWIYAREEGRDFVTMEDIKRAVMSFNSSKLSTLATPLKGNYSFDELKISEGQKNLLKLACSRVRNKGLVEETWGFDSGQTYGRGMSVLLYGPPGTGKTMAATVMANEIGRELYRVDLSQMMDKYIGETEKNLGKVFDAAREGNFILFFDEADSLFAKRTEVSSSNDKHANNEVSYLLQKMEEYDGLSIMATNRFGNFDPAFLRRITYIVNLGKPDVDTRIMLFRSGIPKGAPVDPALDIEFFAEKFELTGSLIRNALIGAAYMAAAEGKPISNKHFVNSIFIEEKKKGQMHTAEDFGKYGSLLYVNAE